MCPQGVACGADPIYNEFVHMEHNMTLVHSDSVLLTDGMILNVITITKMTDGFVEEESR